MGNKIHFESIVVDSHNDTMMKVIDKDTWLPLINIGNLTEYHIDIGKLIKGGVNVAFFAAYTEGYYGNDNRSISRILAMINALYFTADRNLDTFKITRDISEIKNALKGNKIAALATIEGAYGINEDNHMEILGQFYDLGIRAIAPTWNFSNKLGEGCSRVYGNDQKTPSQGGLTKLGKKVIEEMNRLGILVDVSHLSEETFWGVIKTTNSPIIASHSGVYELRNHQRNLKDDQLKAIKENGGLVSIVFFPNFLSDKKEVYIKDLVDHIDYVVSYIGIDHVGLGSDFDGAAMPMDLKDSSQMYKITHELIRRGYEEEDIEKILGGNILRVLGQVERKTRSNIGDLEGDINYSKQEIKIKLNRDIDLNMVKARIIINGISRQPIIDAENSSISYKFYDLLGEKFYLITFEIDNGDKIQRATRMIYTE